MDIMKIMQEIAENHQWDWANEYGEPGYGDSDTKVIVFYNGSGPDIDGGKYPHIEAACHEAGIEFEWSDEWYIDHDNGSKAYRTNAYSYGWQSSIQFTEDGEVLTPDDDIETWIEWAVNDDSKALMRRQFSSDELEEAGFSKYETVDGHAYENGWHQGMDDDPKKIMVAIRETHPNSEVLFWIGETSQSYITFEAFVRQTRTAISSNGFSHDMQVNDALEWLRHGHLAAYNVIVRANSELQNIIMDGAYWDTEAMGVDIEMSSWVADEIENTGLVTWEDGEPYGVVS